MAHVNEPKGSNRRLNDRCQNIVRWKYQVAVSPQHQGVTALPNNGLSSVPRNAKVEWMGSMHKAKKMKWKSWLAVHSAYTVRVS